MMDLTSLQSIEEQLIDEPVRSAIQNTQYMHNLKSQCYFRQNALKTAENLIEEYHRQNQELKLQLARLNLKIQNYQQKIGILNHHLQIKHTSNAKIFQKQLFKSANKLSKVLQKYSELQEKYHTLEKELAKYKFYKQENEERIFKQNNKREKHFKAEIEKQFDNFLRTPANKSTMFKTNPSTSKKQSALKHKNFKDLQLAEFESESNDQDKTKNFYESSGDDTKGHILIGDELFDRKPSIKKSVEKINKMYQKGIKEKQEQIREDGNVYQKLKVLEWKLKQKDQQIILMLRRNKEIEMKYNVLKQIFQDQRQSNQVDQNQDIVEKTIIYPQKSKRINSVQTNPTSKSNRHQETQSLNQDKKSKSAKIEEKIVSHFNSGLKETSNNTRWKNYKTYKLN